MSSRPLELYPDRHRKSLSAALFRNPGSTYRGAPFWSWNNQLDLDQLLRQLRHFRDMGMGGVHIHCRTGLATPYLGPQYMEMVRACNKEAKKLGLLTWLYDEDRWPSGFAGGLVTRNRRYRARKLLLTPRPYASKSKNRAAANTIAPHGVRPEHGTLLARYSVKLADDGTLASYRRLTGTSRPSRGADVWYAYLEVAEPSSWYNNQTYVDTLNPAAIERFIEVTHERYRQAVGAEFGKSIPAIFTDEPQFSHKTLLVDPFSKQDLVLPYTDDLPETFRAACGLDLLETLPEMIWPLAGQQPSLARYWFHNHVAERFASAFADTLGRWCRGQGIALTGHMMEEPTLRSQTGALGEAMRSYRAFDIPGIDMLCDWMELTTAKQAQSAARQYNRPAMASELYGVTGWHFDFAGHKRQGDWQAALGVTVRVHHLAWVSMKGEAKRDYPAPISYQSPWFREYPTIEDHFARLNTALTRGVPRVRVAVIHPIESYWLAFGAGAAAQRERDHLEETFSSLTHWLLFGGIDFDFVAESLLPAQTPLQEGAQFRVGAMAYDAVVVPSLRTLRSSTLERLEAFAGAGGKVIFAGRVPTHVDVRPSGRPADLAAHSQHVEVLRADLLEALEPYRLVRLTPPPLDIGKDGGPIHPFLHQLRQDGAKRYLFICNTDRDRPRLGTRIELAGTWQATLLDTYTGNRRPLAADYARGWTQLVWDCPAHGSLLLEMAPGQRVKGGTLRDRPAREVGPLADRAPVTLSEPNVLLLDQARWRLNDGPWQPVEEILRIGNQARQSMGLPRQEGRIAQPWVETGAAPVVGTLQLCFTIETEIAVRAPRLALEDAAQTGITLDGAVVPSAADGYFVDESIATVALPDLSAGTHELLLTLPLTRRRNVEWCYLLGDFGVQVLGRTARITAPVRSLAFGDWTAQGLPFYAGNVTYHCTLPKGRGSLAVEVSDFAGPTLRAALDGRDCGSLGLAPHRVELPGRGRGRLDLTLFGNRANAFGLVHYAGRHLCWYGPGMWRSTGADWSYEYRLKPMGILIAPRILEPLEPRPK